MIKASEIIKLDPSILDHKVIVFPTDTVYGLGTKWTDSLGIEKIYEIKKRDGRKPIAILVSNINQIMPYIEINYENTISLLNKYWPGAVTFIFKKKKDFEYPTETIAFRMPNSEVALSLIDHFGPLATTSVNLSGEKEINNIDEIDNLFNGLIDYIVCDKEEFCAVSSTIVDLTTSEIKIVRQGTAIINV